MESSISEVSSTSLEEAKCDYQVLSQSAAYEAVLAVASRKDEIEPWLTHSTPLAMKLSALDVDIFRQYNAYALRINHFAPELAAEKVAIFGVYAAQTYALIIQDGKILYKQETLRQRRTAQPTHPAHLSGNRRKSGRNHQLPAKTFRLPRKRGKLFQPADYPRNTKGLAVLLHHADRRRYDRHQAYPADRGSGAPGSIAQTVASQTNADVQCVHPARYFADNPKTDKQQFELDAPTLTRAFGLAVQGLPIMNNLIKINLTPLQEERWTSANSSSLKRWCTVPCWQALPPVAANPTCLSTIWINNQPERNTLLETLHRNTWIPSYRKYKKAQTGEKREAHNWTKQNKVEELQLKPQPQNHSASLNEAVPSLHLPATSLDAGTDSYRLSGRTSSDSRVARRPSEAMPNKHSATRIVKHKKNNSIRRLPLSSVQPIVKRRPNQRRIRPGKRTGGKLNGF